MFKSNVASVPLYSYRSRNNIARSLVYFCHWIKCRSITIHLLASQFWCKWEYSHKRRKILASVRTRMKKSLGWPLHIKIINGLSWAGPFAAISVFHQLYPYLILLGIGLGNMSTYFLIKTYSRNNNKEQYIVGLIALCSIPISIILDNTIFSASYELALFFSRFLIAISYGMGGVYALIAKD